MKIPEVLLILRGIKADRINEEQKRLDFGEGTERVVKEIIALTRAMVILMKVEEITQNEREQ